MKQIILMAAAAMFPAGAALAGNASPTAPAGGSYQPVSELVELPDFLPGMGTLYVDPATLPAGPFAAYDRSGTLVSTIYMIPMDALEAQQEFNDLPVAGDTVVATTMYYNAGHPGVESPHYHVVLWHVAPGDAALE